MDVIAKIVSQAQANIQRIVLPEGGDNRTLIAADKLVADKVADIILMGNEEEIAAKAAVRTASASFLEIPAFSATAATNSVLFIIVYLQIFFQTVLPLEYKFNRTKFHPFPFVL